MPRKLNQASIDLLKNNEGCRLTAYYDTVGVLTIGYGFTFPIDGVPIHPGMTITQETADRVLQETIPKYQHFMDYFKRDFNDNQVGALTSFEWNLGSGIFANDGWNPNADDAEIISEMNKYHRPPEITARRDREVAFYQVPSGTTPPDGNGEGGTTEPETGGNGEAGNGGEPPAERQTIKIDSSDIYIRNNGIYQANNGLIMTRFNNHFKACVSPKDGSNETEDTSVPPAVTPPTSPGDGQELINQFMKEVSQFPDGFNAYDQIRPQGDVATCGYSDCSGYVGWCLRNIHPSVWNNGSVNTGTISNIFTNAGYKIIEGTYAQARPLMEVGDIINMSSTTPFGFGDHVGVFNGDSFYECRAPWGEAGGIFKSPLSLLDRYGNTFQCWQVIRIVK